MRNTAEYDMKTREYQEKTTGFSEFPLEVQKSTNTSTNESATKNYPYANVDMNKKTSIKNSPGAEETDDGIEIQGMYEPFQANQDVGAVTPLEEVGSFSTFNTTYESHTEVAKKPLTPICEGTSSPTLAQENACQSIEGTYDGLNPTTSTVSTFSHQNANPNSPSQAYACEDKAIGSYRLQCKSPTNLVQARKAVDDISQTNSSADMSSKKISLTLTSTKEPVLLPYIPSHSGTDENISPTLNSPNSR